MSTSTALFSASLISPEAASAMPEGFTIRPLEKEDYAKGFLECLKDLTWIGSITQDQFNERFDEMYTGGKGPYYILAIEHQGRIVGAGTLIAEKKFIWSRSTWGHLEEICVSKQHQGTGLGLKMINALDSVAANIGCYRSVLNCSADKEGFYAKCGYTKDGTEMKRDFIKGGGEQS